MDSLDGGFLDKHLCSRLEVVFFWNVHFFKFIWDGVIFFKGLMVVN